MNKKFILLLFICLILFIKYFNKVSAMPSIKAIYSAGDSIQNSTISNSINSINTDCSKNQLLALLMSIFGGFFGLDRFYLEYLNIGIGKILLCGGTLCIVSYIIVLIVIGEFNGGCPPFERSYSKLARMCVIALAIIMMVPIIIFICGAISWYIYDIIQIASGFLLPNGRKCYAHTL